MHEYSAPYATQVVDSNAFRLIPTHRYARLSAVFHIGDVVRKLRATRGWTIDDLVERAGISKMTISRLERGEGDPKRSSLDAIAKAFGLDGASELFALERNQADTPTRSDPPAVPSRLELWADEGQDFVSVALMDGRIAAGQPLAVDDLEISDYISFPKRLMQQLGVTKPRCVRVGRKERSMFPTIYPDAIVLLDCSDAKRERPRNGGIYAVNLEFGSTLKRVTVAGGVVFLSSDNADKTEYPMIEIRPEDHDDDSELPRIIVGEAVLSINLLV